MLTGTRRRETIEDLRRLPDGPEREKKIADLAAATNVPVASIRADIEPTFSEQASTVPPWRPFPVEVFPPLLSNYILTVAQAIGVDPSFPALAVLVTLAGTIGNRARVQLKTSWHEPTVLWGAIVAWSGCLKSPVMGQVTEPVRRREAATIEQYQRDLEEYERAVDAWSERPRSDRGTKPGPPVPPVRSLVSDITVEALTDRLYHSPAGVLLYRDELAAWLRSFDAYRSGRGGDAQTWLEMHRAGPIIVDRKTGRALSVPRGAVSVLGSIQPELLKRCLSGEHLKNGLAARLLFVMPPDRPKRWTDAEIPPGLQEEWSELLESLRTPYSRESAPLSLPLTPQARQIFVDFYNRHALRAVDEPDSSVAAAYSKLEGAGARFALILQLVRNHRAAVVDDEAMKAGVVLAEWFSDEAERIYARFHETRADAERRQLLEWIERRGGTVSERDLARGPRCYRERDAATEALEKLVHERLGRWEKREPGPKGGRPTRVFVLGYGGDGDTTGYVTSGDSTPAPHVATDVRSATQPSGIGEVVSPSPPEDKPMSNLERYVIDESGGLEI